MRAGACAGMRMPRALALALLALLAIGPLTVMAASSDGGHFVGWHGDSYDPKLKFDKSDDAEPLDERDVYVPPGEPVQISERPVAYIWKDFLSKEEARHIVKMAAPRMMRSLVGGGHAVNEVRTSYGSFLPRYLDPTLAAVQERLARWLDLPVSFQEDLQVLRYGEGQRYKQHMDSNGRMCTVLIYLSDAEEGGETAFPRTTNADYLDSSLIPDQAAASECARGHIHVKPERGTALLFYSLPVDADKTQDLEHVDQFSLHQGCPPTKGLKWTATAWVHTKPFRPESYSEAYKPPLPDPAVCDNFHPKCDAWAKAGECDKNQHYMKGGNGSPGQCRMACGVCQVCDKGDHECLEASRAAQGFLPDLRAEFAQLFPDDEEDDDDDAGA